MKTKEKTRRPAKSCVEEKLFPEMKKSDMTLIEQKIHDLLIAEGFMYELASSQKIEGMKANNYRKVSRMEYIRLGRERIRGRENEKVIVITHGAESK